MYATHFELTKARRAVPCFDEPAFKAQWRASIILPADAPDLDALFISPLADSADAEACAVLPPACALPNRSPWRLLSFEITPVLVPSYSVAWAIGSFDFVEDVVYAPHSVRLRVYTPPGTSSALCTCGAAHDVTSHHMT